MSRADEALQKKPGTVPAPLVPFQAPGAGYGAMPPGWDHESESLEPRRLARLLFRHRWQILLVAALVVVPVGIATLLTVPLYRSSALVQVDPDPVQVLPFREIDVPNLTPTFDLFMKSQEQVLKGPTLLARVVARLEAGDAGQRLTAEVPRLHKAYAAQRLENTQIFRLSYLAADPAVAATVANIFADEYLKRQYEARQEIREKARAFLTRELESAEARVQASERDLVAYAQSHNLPVNDGNEGLAREKLTALGTQLSDAELELFATQARFAALRRATVTEFPERLFNTVISGLVSRLAQLENELTVLRGSFGENWPAVVQKRSELALTREQLDREKAAVLAQAREQAQIERDAAENRRALVAASLASQEQVIARLDTASVQYNILRRGVETNRKLYDGLLERLRQTGLSSGMEFGGIHVVESARPASVPDSPRLWWNLLLSSILGLALGIAVALVRDYWDTSISTVEEVEQLTVLPVLGVVPQVAGAAPARRLLPASLRASPAKVTTPSAIVPAPSANVPAPHGRDADLPPVIGRLAGDRVAAEAVRNICASILLSRSDEPPRLLLVTSAVLGEGKTTLVSELGAALADAGSRTLLVECDLRRPTFGRVFGVSDERGLSLFLSGHVGPAPLIHPTANPNLFVVAAGPQTPNPPALLNSDRLRSFLAEMTASFRFVILDAPPVLPIADTRVLAPLTDGVVLVVRAGRASKQLVRKVCWLLRNTGANVLGAVLNGADPKGAGDADYRYYRDYYGQ